MRHEGDALGVREAKIVQRCMVRQTLGATGRPGLAGRGSRGGPCRARGSTRAGARAPNLGPGLQDRVPRNSRGASAKRKPRETAGPDSRNVVMRVPSSSDGGARMQEGLRLIGHPLAVRLLASRGSVFVCGPGRDHGRSAQGPSPTRLNDVSANRLPAYRPEHALRRDFLRCRGSSCSSSRNAFRACGTAEVAGSIRGAETWAKGVALRCLLG